MESLTQLIQEYNALFAADMNGLDIQEFIEQQKRIETLGQRIRELQKQCA